MYRNAKDRLKKLSSFVKMMAENLPSLSIRLEKLFRCDRQGDAHVKVKFV